MEFACESIVRLYDTDAAGFHFYGAQFRFAHEALENFFEHVGLPIARPSATGRSCFPSSMPRRITARRWRWATG